MSGVGRLQKHGICGTQAGVQGKVEARSNFEKSNLQLFRKPACGHWSESNRIEKDRICVPPGLAG